MIKRFFIFISLSFWFFNLQAQDTITVMQYNLLQYGNYNSGFADCYETNNNTQHKDECIRLMKDYVKPDIITVCEFGSTQQLQTDFLRHNLNINGAEYWKTDNIINYAHSNIINHIFYESRKMELKRHVALRTDPRDTDIYELYLKTPELLSGDTIKLVCIVAHPKAGMYYESERRVTMQKAMDYINQFYPNDNVLIMGDFNMYGASESGYRLLTQTYSNHDILFVDPIANLGGVGEWNNNGQFAPFHTQSTRSYSEECFSGGGLDDRFDMILMSDEIYMGFNKVKYVNNSYKAIGNDGRHFNQSINQFGNDVVPIAIADALYDISDHLPVMMKMNVFSHLGVEDQTLPVTNAYLTPNPVSEKALLSFYTPTESTMTIELLTLQGQRISINTNSYGQGSHQFEMSLADLAPGFYLIRLTQESGWNQTLKLVKQ